MRYLRGSAGTILEQVTESTYRRAVEMNGRPVLLTITASGPECEATLDVAVSAQGLDDADIAEAQVLVRRLFSLDGALDGLREVSKGDPVFATVVEECWGLRPVLIPRPFEALVWAILGQQITVAFAAKTKRALAERFGSRLEIDGSSYLVFPTPEALAGAEVDDLYPLQISRAKARYIISVAQEAAAGRLDLEALRPFPDEQALERLQRLTGVGRWTAEYLLMRGLGKRDAMPGGDGGLRQAIARAYGLGRTVSEAEVRARAEAWAGWRGYATFYWWYWLQQQRAGQTGMVSDRGAEPQRCV